MSSGAPLASHTDYGRNDALLESDVRILSEPPSSPAVVPRGE